MSQADLPVNLAITNLPDGVRIDMPRRPEKNWYLYPIAVLFAAAVVIGGMTIASYTHYPAGLVFFCVIFFLFGCVFAIASFGNRVTIEITGQQLRLTQWIGFIHFTSAPRSLAQATRIEIRLGTTVPQPNAQLPRAQVRAGKTMPQAIAASLPDTDDVSAVLIYRDDNPEPLPVALGYPPSMLHPLAEELSRRIARLESASEPLPAEMAALSKPDDPPIPQPQDSPILVDRNADALTLTIPPRGILHGSLGLFALSALWNVIMILITAGLITHRARVPLTTFLFLIPFWIVGIVTLLVAIILGRRSTVIQAAASTLSITRFGLLGTRRQEWNRADIADVRLGVSNVSTRQGALSNLHILLTSCDDIGLLTGRDDDELAWLAYEIRQALKT